MRTCSAWKVWHAECANEHTILQVHASKVVESTVIEYEYKASL